MKNRLKILSILAGVVLFQQFWKYFEVIREIIRPEKVVELVGPYGPLGIISGQILQVIFAPIPPVTAVASGTLYGPFMGAFISIIGASIGTVLAVYVSNRYGRPLVERVVSDANLNRFDDLIERSGYLPFIILFVFPGFPDDALCFIAGLTTLDWKKLAFIGSIGRLPGILMLTTTGYSIAESSRTIFILTGLSIVTISFLSVKYREELETTISGLSKRYI